MSSTPLDSTTPPGGMRAAIKSAARNEVEEQGVLDRQPKSRSKSQIFKSQSHNMHKISAKLKKLVFRPPYNPPRRPAHSAGPPQENPPMAFFRDQNFDHFLTSIFGRFWVVLGRHLGVIFGPFGGQGGPSWVQNAS